MKAFFFANDSFFFDFDTSRLGTLQLPDPRRVGVRLVIVDEALRVAAARSGVVVVAEAQQVDAGDAPVAAADDFRVRRALERGGSARIDKLRAIAAVDRDLFEVGCGQNSPSEGDAVYSLVLPKAGRAACDV